MLGAQFESGIMILLSFFLLYCFTSPAASWLLTQSMASPFDGFWNGHPSTSEYFPNIFAAKQCRSCDDVHSFTQHTFKEHLI